MTTMPYVYRAILLLCYTTLDLVTKFKKIFFNTFCCTVDVLFHFQPVSYTALYLNSS